MARQIILDVRTVAKLDILDVDIDSTAIITINGEQKVKANFPNATGSCEVTMEKGQVFNVRFELQNFTGAFYRAAFMIVGHQNGGARQVYQATPEGKGYPERPVVWQDELVLTC